MMGELASLLPRLPGVALAWPYLNDSRAVVAFYTCSTPPR